MLQQFVWTLYLPFSPSAEQPALGTLLFCSKAACDAFYSHRNYLVAFLCKSHGRSSYGDAVKFLGTLLKCSRGSGASYAHHLPLSAAVNIFGVQ